MEKLDINMLTVVEIAGMQFTVQPGDVVDVPLLNAQSGEQIEFDKILLAGDKIGSPYLNGIVKAELLENWKDKKVIVFKKKRRKGYRRLKGHRQRYSKIKILEINID